VAKVVICGGELGRRDERDEWVAHKEAPGGGVSSGQKVRGRSRIKACMYVKGRLEVGDAMLEGVKAIV
jgi:hypothetical protein